MPLSTSCATPTDPVGADSECERFAARRLAGRRRPRRWRVEARESVPSSSARVDASSAPGHLDELHQPPPPRVRRAGQQPAGPAVRGGRGATTTRRTSTGPASAMNGGAISSQPEVSPCRRNRRARPCVATSHNIERVGVTGDDEPSIPGGERGPHCDRQRPPTAGREIGDDSGRPRLRVVRRSRPSATWEG